MHKGIWEGSVRPWGVRIEKEEYYVVDRDGNEVARFERVEDAFAIMDLVNDTLNGNEANS